MYIIRKGSNKYVSHANAGAEYTNNITQARIYFDHNEAKEDLDPNQNETIQKIDIKITALGWDCNCYFPAIHYVSVSAFR